MQFYTSGLTPTQLGVLKKSGRMIALANFYLAGGTALSIYFNHRRSVDLDWFTSSPLPDPLQFAQFLRNEGLPIITDSTERGTLYGTVKKVRFSFIEYLYNLLQPPIFWEEGNCNLASLDDLACMKLAAVAQRGSRKDFIDVFVLIERYKSLADLLSLYQTKYQTENIVPVLTGLAYFDDAEGEPDPPMWSVKWQMVKQQMTNWIRQI
jgi:predicted nucleotidyltransferase component of viral defense system